MERRVASLLVLAHEARCFHAAQRVGEGCTACLGVMFQSSFLGGNLVGGATGGEREVALSLWLFAGGEGPRNLGTENREEGGGGEERKGSRGRRNGIQIPRKRKKVKNPTSCCCWLCV